MKIIKQKKISPVIMQIAKNAEKYEKEDKIGNQIVSESVVDGYDEETGDEIIDETDGYVVLEAYYGGETFVVDDGSEYGVSSVQKAMYDSVDEIKKLVETDENGRKTFAGIDIEKLEIGKVTIQTRYHSTGEFFD